MSLRGKKFAQASDALDRDRVLIDEMEMVQHRMEPCELWVMNAARHQIMHDFRPLNATQRAAVCGILTLRSERGGAS